MIESRSAKTIVLASGQALGTLVLLVIAAVLARLLDKVDYATFRQTLLVYTFAAPFAVLGLDRALYYFLPAEEVRPRGVLAENLLLLATGGLVLGGLFALGGNRLLARWFNNPGLAGTILILAPYPLLMLPAKSLSACLMARGRSVQVAGFNVVSRLAMLVAVVIPCLLWPRPETAVAALVIAGAVTTSAALCLMFRACPGNARPTLRGMGSQLRFGVPLGLSVIADLIAVNVDKIIVSAVCLPGVFAVYVNGAIDLPLVGIAVGAAVSVLMVDCTKLHKDGRLTEMLALAHRAWTKCAAIIFPLTAFAFVFAPEVMRLLYGDDYGESAVPFRIYLLRFPVRISLYHAIFISANRGRQLLGLSSAMAAMGTVLAWLGASYYGIVGAAAANALVVYIVAVPYLLVSFSQIFKCGLRDVLPWQGLGKVALATAIPTAGAAAVRMTWDVPDLVSLLVGGTVWGLLAAPVFARLRLFDARPMLRKLGAAVLRLLGGQPSR